MNTQDKINDLLDSLQLAPETERLQRLKIDQIRQLVQNLVLEVQNACISDQISALQKDKEILDTL